jgi:hypothetical protein
MEDKSRPHWVRKLLREHPGLLLSLLYVAASTIGMWYSWEYLRRFGINVFEYAQIGDFLLVSLKEPLTWVMVLFAVLVVMFDNVMSRRVQRRGGPRWMRWYGTDRYRSLNAITAIAMMMVFLNIFATLQARQLLEGQGQQVRVEFAEDGGTTSALLLGTTGQFLFLYQPTTRTVTIHPHDNIREIRLPPLPKSDS